MKDQFFAKLEILIAEARRLQTRGFDEQEPEAATIHELILPLLEALGFQKPNIKPEFKILGDSVDYLLKSERPLMFLEAKSLLDSPKTSLFDRHRAQVLRYIQNYRLSPEITKMEQPVKWILLTNFAELHFIRVNEITPSFSFKLADLWPRREELWELLAFENLEADRIDELYDQHKKSGLDQQFLSDLKRWRLLLANGFAFRNRKRSLDEITLASQQLLDRFIFSRMLETHRLIEYNKLARAFSHYEVLYARADKTFAEALRESLFVEIKNDFNTELFEQPLLCDQLQIDNVVLAAVIGHEPLAPELAAQCGFESGQGELLAFRHLYNYDFSRMSQDVMGAVYERFLAHKLFQDGGRVVIEDTDDLRKKEGIYYTPHYIVDYIVAHTLGEKIKPILAEAKTLLGYKNYPAAHAKISELARLKVLDPAMGSGSFLLGAFDALVAAYNDYNAECEKQKRAGMDEGGALFDAPSGSPRPVDRLGTRVMSDNLFGVDLDQKAVEVAKLNLWIRLMAAEKDALWMKLHDPANGKKTRSLLPALTSNLKRGNSLIADQAVAGDAAFDWEKEFPEIMKAGGFDVVIGNPPYERIQTMMGSAPQIVEFLKTNYRSAVSGNFDIYVCFIEHGLQLLNHDGFFGYICPHKFFQAEYGRPVRKLLNEGKHLRLIVSFGDQQIFPQVSTYTCLLFLDKAPQKEFQFIKVDDIESWRSTGAMIKGMFLTENFSDKQWLFTLGDKAHIIEKLDHFPTKLAEVAHLFVGLQTDADDVFILEEIRQDNNKVLCKSEATGKEHWFENQHLKPFLKGSLNIRRYYFSDVTKRLIFPYENKDKKIPLISAEKYARSFPLTWAYLNENRDRLAARKKGKMTGEWHGYIYKKNHSRFSAPKLLVPSLATGSCFASDTDGNYYFVGSGGGGGGGYGITIKDDKKFNYPYLLGVLNSSLLSFYLRATSTPYQGGYIALNRQYIDQLPIKLIDPKNRREAKLEKEIVECVEGIQAAYKRRLKLPDALQKKIAHTQLRTPCNLAHYLKKDFNDSLKHEILIKDVQQAGFVHEVKIESAGSQITLSASVAADAKTEPRLLPILKLSFKDDALRQFIYASWRQFLEKNSRKKKWTTGKKPEPVYPLLVNTLEPLVYFSANAGDNLRAIRDLMKSVAEESGSADLAAIESDIEKLDGEIDRRVYELYGLTPEEIKIVESAK